VVRIGILLSKPPAAAQDYPAREIHSVCDSLAFTITVDAAKR
jgi:hypothetical protein